MSTGGSRTTWLVSASSVDSVCSLMDIDRDFVSSYFVFIP